MSAIQPFQLSIRFEYIHFDLKIYSIWSTVVGCVDFLYQMNNMCFINKKFTNKIIYYSEMFIFLWYNIDINRYKLTKIKEKKHICHENFLKDSYLFSQ